MEKNRGLLWSMLVSFACALVISVSGIVYTGITRAENDQQWCELFNVLDKAYQAEPPNTELGKRVARAISNLRDRFDC